VAKNKTTFLREAVKKFQDRDVLPRVRNLNPKLDAEHRVPA
jgi:hypothetical protein